MDWNEGQKEVLNSISRDHNILVSAAAGSGKTAVLVERIVNSVEAGLCGIDEILVMTFTKAAAAQMKGKITDKLEKRAYETGKPELLRQLALVANADISTIDSFCNRVVRENFQMAGMDPGYGILDTGELVLLREEVMESTLEQLYQKPEFARVAAIFTKKAFDDSGLKQILFRVEAIAESFAEPETWLEGVRLPEGEDALTKTLAAPWAQKLLSERKKLLKDHVREYESVKERFQNEPEPDRMKTAGDICRVLDADVSMLSCALKATDLVSFSDALGAKKERFMATAYSKVYPEAEISGLKTWRENMGKKLKKLCISGGADGLLLELEGHREILREILRGVQLFREELAKEKKRRKKYDFTDIAHAAYRILYDTEKREPTAVGKAYSARYRYIYVDEYQDGSDIQEHIMNSVARLKDGRPWNIFMVGDVKQSIYRFRQAKPELFLAKEQEYRRDDLAGEVLYLNENYRSRDEVLEVTNFFCSRLMREDFGGILYDDQVKLNPPGRREPVIDPDWKAELLLTVPGEDPLEDRSTAEARGIGERIREMVFGSAETGGKPLMIPNEAYDPEKPEGPENPKTRRVRFRDIVILQRSLKRCGKMLREYEKLGIPVQLEDPKAYFDAEEVLVVLSVLQVIDNARQDIPYAALLNSPIGGLTDEDLTRLAMQRFPGEALFDTTERLLRRLKKKEKEQPSEQKRPELSKELMEKLRKVHEAVALWKKAAVYLSISQLIDRILTDTDYRLNAAALPRGDRRQSNLMRLMAKAESFEQAGNHGLFAFLRYIEKCRIHEQSFGDSGSFTEGSDSVQVCTIHSSKGLEYPVVFLARLGDGFSKQDERNPVAVSPRYGIAPNHVHRIGNHYLTRGSGILRSAVNELERLESLHEELRLLYVGMTRAKSLLIMSGVVKDPERSLQPEPAQELPYTTLAGAGSFMDYLLAVIRMDPEEADKYVKLRMNVEEDEEAEAETDPGISLRTEEEKNPEISEEQVDRLAEGLKAAYAFQYPYSAAVETRTKLSVSEIKHAAIAAMTDSIGEEQKPEEGAEKESAGRKKERRLPREISGASYGTAVHKLMELLPFDRIYSRREMTEEIRQLLTTSFFTPELRKAVRPTVVAEFYSAEEGSLFARMQRACSRGELHREQQFLIGIPADRISREIPVEEISVDPDTGEEVRRAAEIGGEAAEEADKENTKETTKETVVVQGVIDAWFTEQDEEGNTYAVLMDYKTDRVGTPEELVRRYRAQLSLYKETLESVLGLPVREVLIYGFSGNLGEIEVNVEEL